MQCTYCKEAELDFIGFKLINHPARPSGLPITETVKLYHCLHCGCITTNEVVIRVPNKARKFCPECGVKVRPKLTGDCLSCDGC